MTNSLRSLACATLTALAASAQALPKDSPSPSAAAAGPAASFGAQTTASASASPAVQAERAIPFHGKVSAVDAKAKTFAIASKEKTRAFKVTDRTTITNGGQPATLKDATINQEVRGSYWKMPDGSMEVKTLKLLPAADQQKRKKAQ